MCLDGVVNLQATGELTPTLRIDPALVLLTSQQQPMLELEDSVAVAAAGLDEVSPVLVVLCV